MSKDKSRNILPGNLSQDAATYKSCTESSWKRCPHANYGSWNGKDSADKTVSNPNIEYGVRTIKYADGKSRAFYQVGINANKTGISVCILGIQDKTYLVNTYGEEIGKASVTGYCIKFKSLKDINIEILKAAIRDGSAAQN